MNEKLTYEDLGYLLSRVLGPGQMSEQEPPHTYHWEFTPTPGTVTAPGWAELAGLGKLNEALQSVSAVSKFFIAQNEALALALRQPPATHRARRYATQERRRRNEALRQMAAYQRRQQARGRA